MTSDRNADDATARAAAELAATGSIRAAVNFGNPVLAKRGAAGEGAEGVAPELARELGRRLSVPVRLVLYDSAPAMADDAPAGAWDVAFLATDPARAATIAFTAPYLELDVTYLVPAASTIRILDEVDVAGVRIVARPRSAYDLFLRRSLKAGTLVYPDRGQSDVDVLTRGGADVLAGLRHVLVETAAARPNLRVLDGRFAAMPQAIGTPQGRPAAAAYLRDFVEDVKTSGLVARAIAARGAVGAGVAPQASLLDRT